MLWEDKVREWRASPVTKAFFAEVGEDLGALQEALVKEADPYQMMRLQGMCRALVGVLDMPEKDGIRDPEQKEMYNES